MATLTSRQEKKRQAQRQAAEQALLGTLSRRTLARRLSLHPSYVSRILRGERRVDLELAMAMAYELDMDLAVFVSRLKALTAVHGDGD